MLRHLELCMIGPRRLEDDQLIASHGIELPAHPNRAPQYTCRAQCPRRSAMTRTKALIHFRTDRHWTYWQGHVRMEAKEGRFNKGHSDSQSRPALRGQEPKAGSRAGVVKGSISTKRLKTSTSTAPGDDLGHGQRRRASLSVVCDSDTSSPYNASESFYDRGIISSPLAEARPSLRDITRSAFIIPNPNLAAQRPPWPPALSINNENDDEEDQCECPNLDEGPTPPETLAATEAYRHWAVVLGLGSHPLPLDSWIGPPRGASGGHEMFQNWGWNVEELDAVKERSRRAKKGESTLAVAPRRPLEVIPEGHTIREGDRAFKRSRGRFKKQSNNRKTTLTPSNRQSLQTNPEWQASCGRNASESGYESNLENEDYTRTPIPAQLISKLQVSPEVVHGALMGLVMMSRH